MRPRSYLASQAGLQCRSGILARILVPCGMCTPRLRQQLNGVARLALHDAFAEVLHRVCKRCRVVCVKHTAHLLRAQRGIDDELDAIAAIELRGCGSDGLVRKHETAIGPRKLAHSVDALNG